MTNIILIPKVKESGMIHFRPISLCNVFYKIITKVFVNRLKFVLLDCIGESQSAFVPGRLISNNVLIAYGLLHALKIKKKGRKGFVAVKLDMSKTYDLVEWHFVEVIMKKMGFHERWISLMM